LARPNSQGSKRAATWKPGPFQPSSARTASHEGLMAAPLKGSNPVSRTVLVVVVFMIASFIHQEVQEEDIRGEQRQARSAAGP
jgi:hypothetical protein